jgi:hypothetical protein
VAGKDFKREASAKFIEAAYFRIALAEALRKIHFIFCHSAQAGFFLAPYPLTKVSGNS